MKENVSGCFFLNTVYFCCRANIDVYFLLFWFFRIDVNIVT